MVLKLEIVFKLVVELSDATTFTLGPPHGQVVLWLDKPTPPQSMFPMLNTIGNQDFTRYESCLFVCLFVDRGSLISSRFVLKMCFGDSDLTSTANDTYIGTVSFPDLVSEPENTIVVSSDYGAPLEVCCFVCLFVCLFLLYSNSLPLPLPLLQL